MKLTQKGITELPNFFGKKQKTKNNKTTNKHETLSFLFWKIFSLLRYLGADKIEVTRHNANGQYKKHNFTICDKLEKNFHMGQPLNFKLLWKSQWSVLLLRSH